VYPSILGKDLSYRIQWLLTPKALERVDKIIVVSEFTKKEIVSLLGINEARICVIPLAVDHSKYYPKNKAECRRKFGLQENGKYILAVASNNENKGMDLTLRVLNKIRENRPDIILLKSGYGEKLSGEGIQNVGYIKEEDMPDLYNCADVFLNTSKYEGALPILEAMSCGLPVVVSNRTAIPEMVDIDKENMVDLYVKEILTGLEIGIDEKAVNRSKNFTWERVAEETIKVYSDVYKTVA